MLLSDLNRVGKAFYFVIVYLISNVFNVLLNIGLWILDPPVLYCKDLIGFRYKLQSFIQVLSFFNQPNGYTAQTWIW